MVPVRSKDGSLMSEFFLLQREEGTPYANPIPTENVILFKTVNALPFGYSFSSTKHFPNTNLKMRYPNIYQVTSDITSENYVDVYYFYTPPYELEYHYMFQFFYNYLRYKYEDFKTRGDHQ